ncbi:hypothetical protein LCGC14_0259070 [marine sediment metagenome]|uniref:Uncharacterized protein n=1 Tax=marine sediment metagenome TaxID=412755 RepID=A0A0F9UJB7_9ZZZZ
MTPAEHIHGSLTAALALRLAGKPGRSAAFVLAAAVPVLTGRIDWAGVQVVASGWLSMATENVITSGHAQAPIKDPPRPR